MGLRPFAGAFSTATAPRRQRRPTRSADHDALQHAAGHSPGINPCAAINDLSPQAVSRPGGTWHPPGNNQRHRRISRRATEIAVKQADCVEASAALHAAMPGFDQPPAGCCDNNGNGYPYRPRETAIAHMQYNASAGLAAKPRLPGRTREFSISDPKNTAITLVQRQIRLSAGDWAASRVSRRGVIGGEFNP